MTSKKSKSAGGIVSEETSMRVTLGQASTTTLSESRLQRDRNNASNPTEAESLLLSLVPPTAETTEEEASSVFSDPVVAPVMRATSGEVPVPAARPLPFGLAVAAVVGAVIVGTAVGGTKRPPSPNYNDYQAYEASRAGGGGSCSGSSCSGSTKGGISSSSPVTTGATLPPVLHRVTPHLTINIHFILKTHTSITMKSPIIIHTPITIIH